MVHSPAPFREAAEEYLAQVYAALAKTKNNSSPGPNRISYRLIKLINDADLGRAILHGIARGTIALIKVPREHRDLTMLMIPKPGNDKNKVNGWRPIVLPNIVGKLGEKVVANDLQRHTTLFHDLHYGSRVNRLAKDAMMVITSVAGSEIQNGNNVILLGKDIVSAFNNVRAARVLEIIRKNNLVREAALCKDFLLPRKFQISWDSQEQGPTRIDDGTPQGSPISPVLWLIYIGNTLKREDQRCRYIAPTPRGSSNRLRAPPLTLSISTLLISYGGGIQVAYICKNGSSKT